MAVVSISNDCFHTVRLFWCRPHYMRFPTLRHNLLLATPQKACHLLPSSFVLLNSLTLTEHVQMLFTKSPELTSNAIQHYKMVLRVIFDRPALNSQMSISSSGNLRTSITSNYLCLQCSLTTDEAGKKSHGLIAAHRFCRCDDYRKKIMLMQR